MGTRISGGVVAWAVIFCATAGVVGAQEAAPSAAASTRPAMDHAAAGAKADALIARLTLDEKINLLGGIEHMFTRGAPRLNIPRLKMTDGPSGTRVWGKSTAYPAGMMLAATWDPALAEREGEQLGRDARSRGCHFLLGPGMNIYRHPLCGRNFEYFGEDPLLTGAIAVGYVRGVERNNVAATIKHFAANNQENDRRYGNSVVDERTLREIYLPAFKRVIDEANPGAAMCSYNKLNGDYCSASHWLLTTVLRDEWKYEGLMMSDWGAVHDTLGPIEAGLNLEMAGPRNLNAEAIKPLIDAGKVRPEQIDALVRPLLTLAISRGWYDGEQTDASIPADNPAGAAVALDVARAGFTLLKNEDGLLPLDRAKAKHVVVVGPHASETPVGGGGSGFVQPFRSVSFADGIKAIAGKGVNVTVVPGVSYESLRPAMIEQPTIDGAFTAEYFDNQDLKGEPVVTRQEQRIDWNGRTAIARGVPRRNFSARWRATLTPPETRTYYFFTQSDDGSRVYVDGELVVQSWQPHNVRLVSGAIRLEAGKRHEIVVEYFDNGGNSASMRFGCAAPQLLDAAAMEAVRGADAVVACVGYASENERESFDRSYVLPAGQEEMLAAVTAANPRTAVVLTAGGSVDMSRWADRAAAVLHGYYAGQEGGTALGEILFGDVNPSGRLPFTVEKQLSDQPSEPNFGHYGDVNYAEGIFVGYRGFDAKKIEPRYPFGFGLSYTTFSIANAKVEPNGDAFAVTVDVKNTGSRAGATVAQLYVAPPQGDAPRPPQELKAFAKVHLAPGEQQTLTLRVPRSDLAFWDPSTKAWKVTPGDYEFRVGEHARNTPAKATVKVE